MPHTAPARRVQRLLLASLAAGFLALAATGVAAFLALNASAARDRWLEHSYQVELSILRLSQLAEQSENGRRGYILTRDPQGERVYLNARRRLGPELRHAARLTRDNAGQQRLLADIGRRLVTIAEGQARTNALVRAGRAEAAADLLRRQTALRPFVRLRARLAAMAVVERGLLREREAAARAGARRFYAVLSAAGVLALLVAAAAFATLRRYTRDLARSDAELRRLNDTLEDQVRTRTADLERANEEIQRFAYIVSHDLRSPLVNVMGFTAELEAAAGPLSDLVAAAERVAPAIVTEEARLAAREDLPEAIGFIRTSTQKMDRLINAILRLSRQGRRVLAPEPLDLGALADGVVASIRHLVDDAGAEVAVRRPMPALVADRVAIEQLLSNLIENAVKYRHPDRPGRVVVSARAVEAGARARVHLTVEDNGRGIAAADHQRIFDLFRRSGAQDRPGEGIGLAHVRALVYRLGGTVDVASELGQGATFTVNLPRDQEAP